jgi:rubredoxin
MICNNCGYENNPDDALSCNLCGKVFRKEEVKDESHGSKKEKFLSSMKEKEYDGIWALGRVISRIGEFKGEERIWLILLLISFGLGFIVQLYFEKTTGFRQVAPVDPVQILIWSGISLLIFIVLGAGYLIFKLLYKIITKIFKVK